MHEETIPTIRPRVSLLAKSPDNGKIICPDTVKIPSIKSAADNIWNDGAKAQAISASTVISMTIERIFFFATRHPTVQ